MQPSVWTPPVDISSAAPHMIKRIKRAKVFVFLRHHRHTLFDAAVQPELAPMYQEAPQGQPPIPPAQLGLATILQADPGVSDDELIEATIMDRRWQRVRDCRDTPAPPFRNPPLIACRQRLSATPLDRRRLERTIDLAAAPKALGRRQLRAARDSRPRWGAGKLEATANLRGHALRTARGAMARPPGRGRAERAAERGASRLGGARLKAARDRDGEAPAAHAQAVHLVLDRLTRFAAWLDDPPAQISTDPEVLTSLAAAAQVRDQDGVPSAPGAPTVRDGVATDRRSSIADRPLRHGRTRRRQLIDGSTRPSGRDLDRGLMVAGGGTPAKVPEATVTDSISRDRHVQGLTLRERHIDRAYLSSRLVHARSDDVASSCRAWPVRNGSPLAQTAFGWDWERQAIPWPDGVVMPFTPGAHGPFPAAQGAAGVLRHRCPTSTTGRTVRIHPDERLLQEGRERPLTPQGRAKVRERGAVDHGLAHIGPWQGDRARYLGERKNVFELRRTAVVQNLHVIARAPAVAKAA